MDDSGTESESSSEGSSDEGARKKHKKSKKSKDLSRVSGWLNFLFVF
jgi:hypothetical protein